MASTTLPLDLAGAVLTRVGYVDVAVPPGVVGLDPAAVARVPWGAPLWAEDGQVRVGAAAWFAEVGGRRIVFDPVQATDGVLRADRATEAAQQDALAELFSKAGWAPESVDLVLMSHIEGVGMVARRDGQGGWSPFFPNARIRLSEGQRSHFLSTLADRPQGEDLERDAWRALLDEGCVDPFADGETLAPGLVAEVTGGHAPGHAVFHLQDGGGRPEVTLLGHLAISPLHLATGECPALHGDAAAAFAALQRIAADGRRLVGPLWPAPGAGRWTGEALEAIG